jgi:ABC-type sugar transport system ATPase subunit
VYEMQNQDDGPKLSGVAEIDPPAVELVGISKRFEGIHALRGVSVSFRSGLVHALVGENGAGKSTLAKVIAGVYRPDEGQLLRDGQKVTLSGPRDAIGLGIAVVYQEPTLLPLMTVEENLLLGHEPAKLGVIRRRAMRDSALHYLSIVGGGIDRRDSVQRLSIAQRQLLEIARALSLEANVLLLDEPTSSLSLDEIEHLETVIHQMRDQKVSVVLITHDLPEVMAIADRVTVLKDGQLAMSSDVRVTSLDDIVRKMVGRDLGHMFPPRVTPPVDAPVVLEVRDLTVPGRARGVDFTLREGVVTGFIGLIGAGRSDVARALVGIGYGRTGSVLLDGKVLKLRNPADAAAIGIALVPEDRHSEGLVLSAPVVDNIALPQLSALSRWGFASRRRASAVAREQVKALRIRTRSVRTTVKDLSGGNQQKVVLAKWLARGCRVLILDEPTRGVDVGAKAEIYELIRELTRKRTAVMLISSELPEILHLADEILVMSEGRIVARLANAADGASDLASEEFVIRSALNLEPKEASQH